MSIKTRIIASARNRVPGVLDDVLKHEAFLVLHELLEFSDLWVEDISATTSADVTGYELVATDTPSQIVRLLHLVNANYSPVPATMETPGTIVLTNSPMAGVVLTAKVSLTVTEPLEEDGWPNVPEWIINIYHPGILDGILARIMSQPAKPYSNERMATYHGRRFMAAKGKAKTQAMRQNLKSGQRWRYPAGWS